MELRSRQARRDKIVAAIAADDDAEALRFDRQVIERNVRGYLDGWRALLSKKQVQDGRQLLREMLAGPLTFTPQGRTYRFQGDVTLTGMFAGMAGVATYLVAVRGFEPRSRG